MSDLRKIAETSLTDKDLREFLGDKIRILEYRQLLDYDTITKLLPSKNDFVILIIEMEPGIGHWVTLVRDEKRIMYFDSYGYRCDKFLFFCPENMRKILGQEVPFLSGILNQAVDDGFKVTFNNFPFQNRNDLSVATCGRWVIWFIEFCRENKHPTIKKFYDYVMRLKEAAELDLDLLVSKFVN